MSGGIGEERGGLEVGGRIHLQRTALFMIDMKGAPFLSIKE